MVCGGTAWLTDTNVWKDYKNDDAVFAIGSPTVELFAASYNSTGKENTIELGLGKYGYTHNVESGWLNSENNGSIYSKNGAAYDWWLASPCGLYYGDDMLAVSDDTITEPMAGNYLTIRPLVCIQTSVFNSKYLDTMVNE